MSFRLHLLLFLSQAFAWADAARNVTFNSNPALNPLELIITHKPSSPTYEPGYYFTCPMSGAPGAVPQPGPAIYASDGRFVWGAPELGGCTDLRTQWLNGTEVLTLWTGKVFLGWGSGHALVLNSTYDVIYNLTTSVPLGADVHEFTIPNISSPNAPAGSTALITSYLPLAANLSIVGGTGNDGVLESYFEEVDIATGKVLFAWNASSHVNYTDTFIPYKGPTNATPAGAWDFFHINSVEKDKRGDYLVSSRHYHQLFKINGSTGDVEWTLGGKHSSWNMGNNTQFSWQHDARWVVEGSVISLFDDASSGPVKDEATARGLVLALHPSNDSVTFLAEYEPPIKAVSTSQGSTRTESNGNILVGWGSNPWITEYLPNGTMIYGAALGNATSTDGSIQNYRALKSTTFKGFPQTWPDTAVNKTHAFVSWNGATEIATWKFYAGASAAKLQLSATKARETFETDFQLPSGTAVFQVAGYDAAGNLLGKSAVRSTNGTAIADGFIAPAPAPYITGPGFVKPVITATWASAVGNDTQDASGH